MKNMRYILVAVLFFLTAGAFAQNNMEDVMYLKNGNVYRGMIIEQVPGVSYKIQIAGGSIFTVTVAEVEKITKEVRYHNPANAPKAEGDFHMGPGFMHHRDTSRTPFYLRKRRPFTEIEFRPGMNNAGLRLAHGYKFGRFGFIGLGIGLDAVSFSGHISDGKGIFNNTDPNNGLYLPLYVHYAGEILKKRATPYYYLEAGYAAHPNNPFTDSNGNKSWGGPIAAAGFGVKLYAKDRRSLAITANVNWRSNKYRTIYTTFDDFGNSYTYTNKGTTHKVFGAIGLALGF